LKLILRQERILKMAKFRKKPVVVEAITFDELVEYGLQHGGNVVNGMPWSFEYKGQPITHENDDCYLVPTLEGTMKFNRGEMLITGVNGEIYPCKMDIFRATYEKETESLAVGDPVFVTDGVDEYEAVIVQWNGDDTLTVMSEATGNRYTVPKDAIRRPELV